MTSKKKRNRYNLPHADRPPSERNAGRHSKYKEEFNDQAYKLTLLGLIDVELANFFEVNLDTLNTWKTVYPKFGEAIRNGKEIADAEVAAKLYHRACGYSHQAEKVMQYEGVAIKVEYTERYPPDTTAAAIWLNNRRRQNWKQKIDKDDDKQQEPPQKVSVNVKVIDARKNAED